MTLALRNCMAMNDPDVFGCLASLCTIQDGNVNRLLSTLSRSDMQLLVVKSDAATARVKQHLQKGRVCTRARLTPICMQPDVTLALHHSFMCTISSPHDVTSCKPQAFTKARLAEGHPARLVCNLLA